MSNIQTLVALVGDLEVSYLHKASENPAATVIYIHGFPFGKEIWQLQLPVLPNRIEGIAYDIRGYGESSSTHNFFNIDLFAADLLALIWHLERENVILCGVSMGGYIALRAFERSPELISGLILCDTNSNADTNEAKLQRFSSIGRIMTEGKGIFAESFLQRIFAPQTFEKKPQVVDFIKEIILALPESVICATQLALASRTDTSHILEGVNVPALIVRGQEDQIMSEQQARFLTSKISGAKFVEIRNSGHLPHLENPDDFNAAMLSFLTRNYL